MNRFDFYKSLYELENKNSIDINNALNVPLTVIVIIGAGLSSFIMNFFWDANFNTYLFVGLCGLSSIFLLLSIILFIIVFALAIGKDYQYQYIDKSDEIEEHYQIIKERYKNRNEKDYSLDDLEEDIIRMYAIRCGKNTRINERKTNIFSWAKRFLVFSLFSLIIAFIPFLINHFYHIKIN